MDMWTEELRHVELSSDVGRAEQCLQMHSDAALHVQNCIIEVMQVGQDLLPVSGVAATLLSFCCFLSTLSTLAYARNSQPVIFLLFPIRNQGEIDMY